MHKFLMALLEDVGTSFGALIQDIAQKNGSQNSYISDEFI